MGLKDGSPIGKNEFEKTNWLPVSNGADQCLAVLQNAFSPKYMDNIWNDLNQDIKAFPSANSFKAALRRRFFKS